MSQSQPPHLLDQVRQSIHLHYSLKTEKSYVHYIRDFILFHHKHHLKKMGNAEIEAFLTYLAVEGQVSASTQNPALSALLVLYREVLKLDMVGIDAVCVKRSPPSTLSMQAGAMPLQPDAIRLRCHAMPWPPDAMPWPLDAMLMRCHAMPWPLDAMPLRPSAMLMRPDAMRL